MRCAMSVRLLPMNARAWFASVLHEVAAWASGCGLCSTLGLTNFARIADTTGVRITTGPICGNSHDRYGKSLWHGRQESTRDETRRYQEHHATRINNVSNVSTRYHAYRLTDKRINTQHCAVLRHTASADRGRPDAGQTLYVLVVSHLPKHHTEKEIPRDASMHF